MKILVVDDGQLAINSLIRILCRVAPDCDYITQTFFKQVLSGKKKPKSHSRRKLSSCFWHFDEKSAPKIAILTVLWS